MVRKRKHRELESAEELAYSLHCTVCTNNFASKSEWLRHLPTPDHQDLARVECYKVWGEDKAVKECVVVLFCSFSLSYPGTVEQVLSHFSGKGGHDVVTDFVWWPERPRVGYLQFESRKKVAEIFQGLDGPNGYVADKLVQLKTAVDMMQLEWKELLPPDNGHKRNLASKNSPHLQEQKQTDASPSPKPMPTGYTDSQPLAPKLVYDEVRGSVVMKRPLSVVKTSTTSADFCDIPIPLSSCITNAQSPLQIHFNSVCKYVEIPNDEFQHSVEILNTIKQIFTKEHPSGQVMMFRNYYLRLRNTGTNILLLYAYIADNPGDPNRFMPIVKSIQDEIFKSSEFKQLLPGFKKKSFENCSFVEGTPYQHETSGFQFNFVTDPLTIAEAHLSRLLQYLCAFDPRARPLLSVVYYWAKSHNVRIAEENIPKEVYCSNCPEPVALEWLVMLFLIHEHIIPSVREVLQHPHKPLLINEVRQDINFSTDPEYVQEWKRCKPPVPGVNSKDFVISVAQLADQFFRFYAGKLKAGSWLLNPKDGEIIKREGTNWHKSNLTPEETAVLSHVQCSQATRSHLIISKYRIFMLHPLYITRRLSFCVETWNDSTCAKMMSAAVDLRRYIKLMTEKDERSVNEKRCSDTLGSALAGGRQKSEMVQLELQCETNQSLRTAIRTRVEQRKRQSKIKALAGGNVNKSKRRK